MLVQVRAVPKRRSTHISNYQSNECESYEHDETSMTEIPVCPRERFSSYKTLSRLVPCYKRDWATLLHRCYFCYLLLATNHLTTQSLVTDNFSACRYFLAENHLSDPSAPRWVRHSYLSKGLRLIPYTCGSSRLFSGAVAGEWSAFGKWNFVRKHSYTVLKFIVTCHYGN